MVWRLIHEPLAREIGQPLPTLPSLNKFDLTLITNAEEGRKDGRKDGRKNNRGMEGEEEKTKKNILPTETSLPGGGGGGYSVIWAIRGRWTKDSCEFKEGAYLTKNLRLKLKRQCYIHGSCHRKAIWPNYVHYFLCSWKRNSTINKTESNQCTLLSYM